MTTKESIYQALVSRRLQRNDLLWQVPVLAMTAQAFLYTISLGPDTAEIGRYIAASLSIVISYLTLTLMKTHRIAELTDSHLLEDMEKRAHKKKQIPKSFVIHGRPIPIARSKEHSGAGYADILIPRTRGYRTWIIGLVLFGMAAPLVILLTALVPAIWDGRP